MQNAGFLFAAYVIIWALFFIYLFYLAGRQGKLRREIDMIKQAFKDKKE